MKVKRQELMDALLAVRPAVTKDAVIDGANNIFFIGNEVLAYDDEVCISKFLDTDTDELDCAVPEKPLIAFLKKLKAPEVELIQGEGEIIIRSKRTEAGINIASVPSHLSNLNIPEEWNELPMEFAEALDLCLMSVGTDMSLPVLCNLHLFGKYVESLDNARGTRYTLPRKVFGDFLLPAEAAKRVKNINPSLFFENPEDPWVHFYNEEDEVTVSARKGSGDFQNLDDIMVATGDSYHFPPSTKEALDRAAIFAKSESITDDIVKITLDNGEMCISAEGSHGWVADRIPVPDYENTKVVFWLNPNFFDANLLLTHGVVIGDVTLAIKGERFIHVVRLQGEA